MLGMAVFPSGGEVRVTAARRRHEAPVPCAEPGCSTLVLWAERAGRRRAGGPAGGGLRFAFYGRVSTEDWQDPVTSRARQREQAGALVRGHGIIAAEFFDIGESRSVAWAGAHRPRRWSPRWRTQIGAGTRSWSGSTSGRSTVPSTR